MINNPKSPWRNEAMRKTISRMSDAELDYAIVDKEKEGYKVTNRYNYYDVHAGRKYVAVLTMT